MTINTTTIDKIPVIEDELTGEENILIQSSPNAQTMGSRSLNTLKTFFGSTNDVKTNVNNTSDDGGITYIKNTEYAKTLDKGEFKFDNTKINGESYSSVFIFLSIQEPMQHRDLIQQYRLI